MTSNSRHTAAEPKRASMTPDEVRLSLDALSLPEAVRDHDPYTRLAWRPAWSIRSRRGAMAAFRALFRRSR